MRPTKVASHFAFGTRVIEVSADLRERGVPAAEIKAAADELRDTTQAMMSDDRERAA
ncbi:MAG: hypothetical protein M3081_02700 [Gemmatimonadota bacterium]|nr:hypothetical protein [Gemmatimonadota bacterium]